MKSIGNKKYERRDNGTFKRDRLEGKTVNGIKFAKYTGKSEKNGYPVYETVRSFCGKTSEMPSYRYSRRSARCDCEKWKQLFAKPLGRPANPDAASHVHRYFETYKRSALSRGLAFDLTVDEFREIIEMDCFYCGAHPKEKKIGETCSGTYRCNGIDRADNNLGYTKENSVPCCSECNFCKGTLSKDKFLDLVRKVYEHSFNTKA